MMLDILLQFNSKRANFKNFKHYTIAYVVWFSTHDGIFKMFSLILIAIHTSRESIHTITIFKCFKCSFSLKTKGEK